MAKCVLAVLLGAFVSFAWGFVSWVILPWHMMTANAFSDEKAVAQFLKENAPQKGIYYLPFESKDLKVGEPSAFVNLVPNGFDTDMPKAMGIGFGLQILSALLVLLLLCRAKQSSYGNKVLFVSLVGFAIGFISHAPLWNWFSYPLPYVGVQVLDSLIGWSLAGLVMAKFVD